MVRSGQMILATALHRHLLNQEWRFTTSNVKDLAIHKQVSKWLVTVSLELTGVLPWGYGTGVEYMHGSHGRCMFVVFDGVSLA